ncbi:MAG: ImmA/IrrE family metallo-endopeptidase [Solobacterium sp.]|nr:ImmA/IrrE family metallo-endopeptidase [Solobacterium sp.]
MNKQDLPNALVRRYGTRDPFQIARMCGISVRYVNTKKQKGFCKIILNNPFIFLSQNMSEQMQRMTCAHELGHLLLHRRLLTTQSFLLEYELFDIRNAHELEANVFAADLLIDEPDLIERLHAGDDMITIASSLDINVNLLMIKLIEMQKRGVSIPVPFTPDRKFLGRIEDTAESL